ncbi:MAG TPA: NifU family protein [Mucilaginibacter sp.]|jgi:Fe-S cluster biogenesis protein NfuA|nr:NifU family protein [Mucilaginibacter sp.]
MSDKEKQVQAILKTLLPAMEADGGGVELFSIDSDIVHVRFSGACLLCPSIGMTMKFGIEKTLKEKLPWIKKVERDFDNC